MTSNTGAAIICAGSMASDIVATRALGRNGIPVVCVAHDASDPLFKSKYCTERHVIPSPKSSFSGYLSSLETIADQEHVQTFLPLAEAEIYALITHRDRFDSLFLPLVDEAPLETVQDRLRLLERAEKLDVPIPETTLLGDWTEWDVPAIVKSRYAILERDDAVSYPGVEIIDPGRSPNVDAIEDRMGHEPLVQRYVTDGTEFGYFALFDHGEPVLSFQHRRIRSTNYFGGASSHRTSVSIPELEKLGERLLRDLNWHGPAMVEFRRDDSTGSFKLMEINPRFWGSLGLSVAAGIDFPLSYYRLSRGETIEPASYEEGVTASYLWAELLFLRSLLFDEYPDFVDKPSVFREIVAMVSSFPRTHFDALSMDDPMPFLWDYYQSVRTVMK